jgi:hypothetical protein
MRILFKYLPANPYKKVILHRFLREPEAKN